MKAELVGVTPLRGEERPWGSGTLLHKNFKQFTAKVYVFSDSVLCLNGKCDSIPSPRVLLLRKNQYVYLDGSVPENWTISTETFCVSNGRFPKGTRQSSFFEITNMIDLEYHPQPEDFEGRIIFHVRAQRRRLDNEK